MKTKEFVSIKENYFVQHKSLQLPTIRRRINVYLDVMVHRACDTLPRSINTTELSASINKLWGFQSKQKEHNIHNKNVYINTLQIISSGKKPQCIQVRLLHYEIRLTFCPLALVHTCLTVWNSQVATKNCKSSYSHSSYRQSGVIQNFLFRHFPRK